jgi:hypothetical protein
VLKFKTRKYTRREKKKYLWVAIWIISPAHTQTEGRAPVWGSEFTTKAATQQGNSDGFIPQSKFKTLLSDFVVVRAARCPPLVWLSYKHSEQSRAPRTRELRDVARCGALSLLHKRLQYRVFQQSSCTAFVLQALAQSLPAPAFRLTRYLAVVPRLLPAAALVVRHRYLIVVRRPLPAAPLVQRRRYLIVAPGQMIAAPRRYLTAMPKAMPAAPRRYLFVVTRP